MIIKMNCPTCGSHDISKNGTTQCSKQNYKCRDYHRQFIEDPQWKPKDKYTQALVNLLLLEKSPLASINRSICISYSWLQCYAKFIYEYNQMIREIISEKDDLNILTVIY